MDDVGSCNVTMWEVEATHLLHGSCMEVRESRNPAYTEAPAKSSVVSRCKYSSSGYPQ